MTREECVALLERYAEYDGMGIPNLAGCREAMRMAADLLSQHSTPSDLNEAAEDFVWEVMENDEDGISDLCRKLYPTSKISDFYDALGEFFKAGAEWTARQMKQEQKDTDWISVKDRLPKVGHFVLTCVSDTGTPQCVGMALLLEDGTWWDGDMEVRVDYWMEVPKFNNEKK